ncbi:hypothetical protein MKK70_21465 [Methylobacterium sp. E-041]|uniref:hypothetical protein n=1 Tax=Methylobacterium sp. E-041 TaxID=2836573 RepID=UPI001FB9F32F|nr:hypothetical protein [Methylobacterium sp. E-041]MCJ2107898.1 hypothetical protein [Methylobacterium sp. E-041]
MSPYTRANLTAAHGRKDLTLHFRPPFSVRSAIEPTVVDADNQLAGQALPGPPLKVRMLLAEEMAAGLNARCGVPEPALADRFDPHHGAAVEAESRQQAERMNRGGRLPDAAE